MGIKQRVVDWLRTAKDSLVSNTGELKSLLIEVVSDQAKEVIKEGIIRVMKSILSSTVGAAILQFVQFPSRFWGQGTSSRPISPGNNGSTTTELPAVEPTENPMAEETVMRVTTETSPPMATQFFNDQFFLMFALLFILFLGFFSIRARQ